MRTVKIADAKNNLSRHLAYVKRGGRVRILDRNVPIADLVPIEPSIAEAGDDEALLSSLDRRGLIQRGKGGPLRENLLSPGPRDRNGRLLAALLLDRRSGR